MIRNEGAPTTMGWYWRETDDSLTPTIHWIRRVAGEMVFGAGPYDGESVTSERHIGARWQNVQPPKKETP